MKIAFISSVEFGKECINEIYKSNKKIDILFTLKSKIQSNNTGRYDFNNLKKKYKFKIIKIKPYDQDIIYKKLISYNIEIVFVIGWSSLLDKKVLNIKNIKFFGMHPSPLPIGRGRAPIPNTILKRLKKSALSFFILNENVDSGDIIDQIFFKIPKKIDAYTLYNIFVKLHKTMMRNNLDSILNNSFKVSNQDNMKATYWPRRRPVDGLIRKNMSIKEAEILVRACTKPYPGAYFDLENYKLIIWKCSVSKKKIKKSKFKLIKLKDGYLKLKDYEIKENV